MGTVMAWHFVGDTLRDGRPVPRDGEWLEHAGDLLLCASGLHACAEPFDALQFAPGPTLCRVECGGKIIKAQDKLVCSRRKIIKRIDATVLLRRFAADQALSVAQLWKMPAAGREYLMSLDETKRAAAWAAARNAAWAAAWAAARAAAWDAARDAALDAARDAARAEFNRRAELAFRRGAT